MTHPARITVDWTPRVALAADVPALEALIPISVRTLQAPHYNPAQMEAALGPLFAVDRQLIRDGTCFVVEHGLRPLVCGLPLLSKFSVTRNCKTDQSMNLARGANIHCLIGFLVSTVRRRNA